jgi:ABC-type branched-subunit amino acid transport system permease subunit
VDTLFDLLTVASFFGLVIAFVVWTERDRRTLLHFMISAVVLAVANQTGNAGYTAFASILIVAAVAYAAVVVFRPES